MGATAPPVQASGQLLAFSTMSPLQTGPRKFYLYTHHLQLVTMPSPTQVCFPSQGFRCARWGHGTYPSRPGTRWLPLNECIANFGIMSQYLDWWGQAIPWRSP